VGLLAQVRANVDERLAAFFDERFSACAPLGPDAIAMLDAVRDLTLRGGKRLRPALLFAAYRAIEGHAPAGVAYEAGVALELLQSYLLIHDDWMDRDDVRRGGPAVHVMLTRHFGSRAVGEASAILAGDHAAALAQGVMAGLDAAPERVRVALSAFARMIEDTTLGQQLDLAGRTDDIERVHDLKTGSYTVRGPMLIGAALAGADDGTMSALCEMARPVGIAFQLRDDLLGTFGDPKTTGKPVGTDVRSGKRTSLTVEALARANAADRKTLEATLGRRSSTMRQIARVAAIYERSGARAAVEARLGVLEDEAKALLRGVGIRPRARAVLLGAVEALTTRAK
jgi:geranylgeranyl diphosphate synthase, type I